MIAVYISTKEQSDGFEALVEAIKFSKYAKLKGIVPDFYISELPREIPNACTVYTYDKSSYNYIRLNWNNDTRSIKEAMEYLQKLQIEYDLRKEVEK